MALAPAPVMTIFTSASFLSTTLSALMQRGERHHRRPVLVVVEDRDVQIALQPLLDLEAARGGDVLEVDPAEDRRDGLDRGTISSTSLVSSAIGKASTPANYLKMRHLPSITGIAAAGPMSPSPSTAVPSVTTATVFCLIVRL